MFLHPPDGKGGARCADCEYRPARFGNWHGQDVQQVEIEGSAPNLVPELK